MSELTREGFQELLRMAAEMIHTYRVMYHPDRNSVKPRMYQFRGVAMDAEDVLTKFKLDHPDATPLSVQKDADFLWTLKQELACPYCGGVDAHLPSCQWGYPA